MNFQGKLGSRVCIKLEDKDSLKGEERPHLQEWDDGNSPFLLGKVGDGAPMPQKDLGCPKGADINGCLYSGQRDISDKDFRRRANSLSAFLTPETPVSVMADWRYLSVDLLQSALVEREGSRKSQAVAIR